MVFEGDDHEAQKHRNLIQHSHESTALIAEVWSSTQTLGQSDGEAVSLLTVVLSKKQTRCVNLAESLDTA